MIKKLLAWLALTAVAVGAGYASGTATSNEKIKNLEIQNEEIQSALDESEANLEEARLALAQMSLDLDSKNTLLAEKEALISAKDARIAELEEALNNADNGAEIAELQEQISILQNEKETLQGEINSLTADKMDLLALIEELRARINELESSSTITPASYFQIDNGVITGFSNEAQTLYNNGELTCLYIPDTYSLGEEKEYQFEKEFASKSRLQEYLETEEVSYPISIVDRLGTTTSFNNYDEFSNAFSAIKSGTVTLKYTFLGFEILDGKDFKITEIGNNAFNGYGNLTKVRFSKNITSIGEKSFYNCSMLDEVQIPEGELSSLGVSAFGSCKNLKNIYIPSKVSLLNANALFGCTGLTNIEVSKNNPIYDSRDNCNAIIETSTNVLMVGCASTLIPEDIVEIGEYAFRDTLITSITIPNSVIKINTGAFYYCANLTEIILSENLTLLGNFAFFASALTSITIPSKVTTIGEQIFYACKNLIEITVLAETPPTLSQYSAISTATNKIYVPANSVERYKSASAWSNFASYITAIPT